MSARPLVADPPRRGRLLLLLAVPVLTAPSGAEPPLPDPLTAGWKGEPVCESLHDAAELRVLRCRFPPAGGHERHFHAPHFGYVLEGGRMRITDSDGTRELELTAGADWQSAGVEWHEVVNVGDTTSSYLIVEPRASATPGR